MGSYQTESSLKNLVKFLEILTHFLGTHTDSMVQKLVWVQH